MLGRFEQVLSLRQLDMPQKLRPPVDTAGSRKSKSPMLLLLSRIHTMTAWHVIHDCGDLADQALI